MGRWDPARTAHALSVAATSGAAVVVLLLYVPALASPFSLPKEVAFELAAALGFGAFALRFALRGPQHADQSGRIGDGSGRLIVSRPVAVGAGLVFASVALSAVIAARAPNGAPYALPVLGRWAALFGLTCGAAVAGGTSTSRTGLLHAVTATAAIVSAVGLWQHADLLALPIPVISAPGSTFGNRNLAGEAVALSIPFGLGALSLARRRWERAILVVALTLEFLYLAATRARGAWIGGAAGVLTVAILDRRSWSRAVVLAVLGMGALALVVAVVPGRANPRYAADTKRLANGVEVVEISFDPGSPALRTRLGLWRRSLAMIQTAPLTGVGPGNWPRFFPQYAEPGAAADGVLSPALSPRHAHNDLVECLTETGALGLGSLLVLAVGVVVTVRRKLRVADAAGRVATAAAAGTLVALLGAGVTGFPLEMPATLALSGLALGLISSTTSPTTSSTTSPSTSPSTFVDSRAPSSRPEVLIGRNGVLAALAVGILILAMAVLVGERRIRGSAWLGTAENALHADPGLAGASSALHALDQAEAANPGSFRVALRRAHAALRLHRMADGVRAAEAALVPEPFSPNAWATLAAAQLGAGDPNAARISAERCLELLHSYPFALSVKANASEAIGDYSTAESTWARLETLAVSSGPDKEITASAQLLLRERNRKTVTSYPSPTPNPSPSPVPSPAPSRPPSSVP